MEAPVADCQGIGSTDSRLKCNRLYRVDLVAGSGGTPLSILPYSKYF